MSLDAATFEEQKYVDFFPKLQQAYKSAFNTMNEQYDSTYVHAIDQTILNESEPVFEDGQFHIELPADPETRIDGVVDIDDDRLAELLEEYTATIETELCRLFEVEQP
ncbi:DUF5783 family protein [Halosegnis longus]|uniref:Uncharacterized protein n=1 Tax=Halosegnis longus TaxID=2216012 RepID=A0AAJ4R728_9EURY|nr:MULTISPECIES: DUF5783 family protein [Halobacteriales]RNJ25337.1 hypothetical protein Nmn1133_00535 [Salella cibi]